MPVHFAPVNALENDDPVTWEALKSGDFVVAKSDVAFTRLFTDQTHDETSWWDSMLKSRRLCIVIKGRDFEEVHTHEKAITLIPNQVLASAAEYPCREVCVQSPDTDTFSLHIDLVSRVLLAPQTHPIFFCTRKGRKYRDIYIIKRVQVMGTRKCQGFIGLHNFSGADGDGKFVGINKKIWADAYMALDEDDSAIDCF